MKFAIAKLGVLLLLTLWDQSSTAEEIGADIKNVPIFDTHMHYKEPAWGPYPVETVIELMDKSGVAMALVSSTPDLGTIQLLKHAPNRIVAELRPYHGSAGSSNWTKSDGMIDYIRTRLEKFSHEGIGEFHIHRIDPNDESLLRAVAQMAKTKNIPLHIHSGATPIELFYRFEPDLTIIWAHAGMSEPPETVDRLLSKFSSLYADTSFRENDILNGEGTISDVWLKVIKRHSERLMVGTDTWVNGQWDNYVGLIELNRRWLSKLPKDIAEKIAYKNAAKLFKRDVSRGLIGTN